MPRVTLSVATCAANSKVSANVRLPLDDSLDAARSGSPRFTRPGSVGESLSTRAVVYNGFNAQYRLIAAKYNGRFAL